MRNSDRGAQFGSVGVQLDREVAVGVVDGPDPGESGYRESCFLPKLPASGGLRRLAPLDPAPRELPEAGK